VSHIVARAEELTGKLFALRLLEAGEKHGWGYSELISEAVDHEEEVRHLLLGEGDPLQLPPELLARLLWRVNLLPADWNELLMQYVASNVSFEPPAEGEVWARATGHTAREAAGAFGSGERDPERASRVARSFVAEVVEEWENLVTGETNPDENVD
jgi:hypothetical protein